jgi:hypothetical protein
MLRPLVLVYCQFFALTVTMFNDETFQRRLFWNELPTYSIECRRKSVFFIPLIVKYLRIHELITEPPFLYLDKKHSEPVLLNVYEAPELIPRNEFRQPM